MSDRGAQNLSAHVLLLSQEKAEEAVDVLCEAFHGYPAMRYVLGSSDPGYVQHLRTLVRYFVTVRFLRGEPVLGILDRDRVVAVAIITLPGEHPYPPQVSLLREELWSELGGDARERYEAFGEAAGSLLIDEPHYHLNMVGVRDSHKGLGYARKLLEHIHGQSANDSNSVGVTLSTETPDNLSLYEHFGYGRLGHARVSDLLETWVLFRPDSPAPGRHGRQTLGTSRG